VPVTISPRTLADLRHLHQANSQIFSELLATFEPDDQLAILDAVLLASDEAAPAAPPAVRPAPMTAQERYAKKKDSERARQRALTEQGRDIGPIPDVADPHRRSAAASSLRIHLETYHAETYNRSWAQYHYAMFERIEAAIFDGGWFAVAVPRGGGKTAICEGAVEWALLHGHKRWPMFVGGTEDKAVRSMKNIKSELQLNPLLLEDFPEILFPIQSLEGSSRRCEGQLCCGTNTSSYWGTHQVVLPTLPEHEWSRFVERNFISRGLASPTATFGHRISVAGLTGNIRGLSEKTPNLEMIRPDFVLADDPQTRESAKSVTQSQYRFQILTGDIAYLSGGQQRMSVVVPCTVIYRGDLADQILDRDLNPEWRAERHRMLITLPERLDLWGDYAEIRRECLRLNRPITEANDFYLANQAEMDRGAASSWPERFLDDEHSAIQHGMNLKIRDEVSWWAEAQNEPIADADAEALMCPTNAIMVKQHHCERGTFPMFCEKVAAHIDVQQKILYYAVMGASTEFECAVGLYGTVPDQRRNYFSLNEDLRTLQQEFPGEAVEVALYRGIQAAIAQLATGIYRREDGVELDISRIHVDCGWLPETVIKACRESPFSAIVLPVQGISVRAKDTPLALRTKKTGETRGHEWIVKPKPDMLSVRYGQVNVNYWKNQVHQGFAATTGPGAISLYKDRAERHRMIAEHCNAEVPVKVTANETTVIEWSQRPDHPDNHLFDNLVGCLAALSMAGCKLPAHEQHALQSRRTPKIISRATLRKT
jgi:hypothetical protein